ncbi:hypothetical protein METBISCDRAFT_18165 [Metschnikowia bicuspidata]|uniref:Glycosyltransferase family 24 protein n=1 Tax=Metschnikowia bicuspidata TaxID=27322 RepID=A0A4P9ZA53_9ASCO|nr:hypothetical protein METBISCDRAFT_18165 [Metschnikowia bicuspidata]
MGCLIQIVACLLFTLQIKASTISIGLQANWTAPEFAILLIEASSLHNESLYYEVTKALFQSQDGESDWDEEWADTEEWELVSLGEWPLTDRQCYELVTKRLLLVDTGFINLNLANKMASPRIKAHYSHFATDVESNVLPLVEKQCAKDSFGQPLDDPTAAWVKYGSRIYCSEEDLYALQLRAHLEEICAFDRVFGDNLDAPVLVFYGKPSSERFAPIFRTLFNFANAGTIRFVWRYMPLSSEKEPLYGYGTTFTVQAKGSELKEKQGKISFIGKFLSDYRSIETRHQPQDELVDVAYKATALVLKASISEQLLFLSEFVRNIPLYAPYLAKSDSTVSSKQVQEAAQQNERIGASSDMVGISINGATVHRLETDLPFVISKLKSEVQLINSMLALGFTTTQAKHIFSKNALYCAIKEHGYKTGSKFNRFEVYKDLFSPGKPSSGGVVFFNNIEDDANYELLSPDRYEIYVENANQVRMGQVPPLRENVHDMIFVINLSDKNQLRVFFTMSKIILDNGIPQQLGILPFVSNGKDKKVAALFYHLIEVGERHEAMALLYKYYDSEEGKEDEVLDLVALPDNQYDHYKTYQNTLDKFDIAEPSVIVNGIIHNLRASEWQTKLVEQVSHDVKLLRAKILEGLPNDIKLRDALHQYSHSKRNRNVVPQSPANIRYKRISKELIDNSIGIQKFGSETKFGPTFWLIGDFNSLSILNQFKEVLRYMKSNKKMSSCVRIFNTALQSKLLDRINDKFGNKTIDNTQIDQLLDLVGDLHIQTVLEPDNNKLTILRNNRIQLHNPVFLFNSRYIKIGRLLEARDLKLMVEYEFSQRLNFLADIVESNPSIFEAGLPGIMPSNFDPLMWFDLTTSVITDSIFLEDSQVRSDFGRFDFSSLNFENRIDLTGFDPSKHVDILVVVDPLDALSQKLLSMATSLADLPFVNMMVLIQPFSKLPADLNIDRFYSSNFVPSKPKFDADGNYKQQSWPNLQCSLRKVLSADLDAPHNWHYVKGDNTHLYDLDKLGPAEDISANFTLSQLVVVAHVKDVLTGKSIPGLVFDAQSGEIYREGRTLQTKGYCQLRLEPGNWLLLLKKDTVSSTSFELLSASSNQYEPNDQAIASEPLLVHSLYGQQIYPRIRRRADNDREDAFPITGDKIQSTATVNLFCVVSGFTQEQFLAFLMKSASENTCRPVKLWLLEMYVSEHFLRQLPELSSRYNFQYELLSYKWPLWLRQQKDRVRQVMAHKALFLDVLFPETVDKVIVVDADLVVISDLSELIELDMHEVYGFVPMCEHRPVSEKFWHAGYWKDVLKDDLHYYSSSMFVVDVARFRAARTGEHLRRQYQKLSSDINSLVHLDQDLFNYLQHLDKIDLLPAEWNWNPAWCSANARKNAKIVNFALGQLSQSKAFIYAQNFYSPWTPLLTTSSTSLSQHMVHDEL